MPHGGLNQQPPDQHSGALSICTTVHACLTHVTFLYIKASSIHSLILTAQLRRITNFAAGSLVSYCNSTDACSGLKFGSNDTKLLSNMIH
jgi:hypothetical protein